MKENKSILRETSPESRPYERCLSRGPEALSDVELLSVLLRTGTKGRDVISLSSEILSRDYAYEGLAVLLHRSYEEYMQINGIGKVRAIQLLCLGELCRRIWRQETAAASVTFTSPQVIAGYYRQEMRFLEREQLRVAFIDLKRRYISDITMTVGTINSSLVNVREILIEALRHRAVGIIVLHNHPGGDPYPSEADVEVTQRLREACEVVGIRLFDHVIIAESGYFSFAERKMMNG